MPYPMSLGMSRWWVSFLCKLTLTYKPTECWIPCGWSKDCNGASQGSTCSSVCATGYYSDPLRPLGSLFFSVVLRGRCASLLWPFPSKNEVGTWIRLNSYTTVFSCLRDGNPVNSIRLGGKVFGDQKSCVIKDGMNLPSTSQQEKGQKGLLRVRIKGFPISSRRGNFQVHHLE